MKVFLGDLVHTWGKTSVWTMPLNIGFVASYAQSQLSRDVTFQLFKRPELMIDAIKTEKPDVVALSYYVWNMNLTRRVFQVAREHCPDALRVGGGPVFTNINANEHGARRFFERQPECDLFVVNQGERGFLEVLTRFAAAGGDVRRVRRDAIAGCLVNDVAQNDAVHVGTPLDPVDDLNDIPSPYLNGMLDQFFDDRIIPIIETNRSCPYRCTFCAWGIGTTKLAQFGTDRIMEEIDYIADRCRHAANLYFADANFAILERDADIARKLYESHERKGFPGHVLVQWNKTRPDRVLRVAQEFRGLAEVGASMQSLNPAVLDAIKRKNLPVTDVVKVKRALAEQGQAPQVFSELILGLPMETWQSHVDANKALIDLGAEVFNYNLHLLPGTEMDTEESRSKYFHRTGWRLHDNAYGVYDGAKVFEGQEVVLETSTMSIDELRSFRFIHFLLQFLWGRKWYVDLLMLFKQHGVHPVDLVVDLSDRFKVDDGTMGKLYAEFRADHDLEAFKTEDDLIEYWSREENLARLQAGTYGKLNYLYTYRVLLEHQEAFHDFLMDVARAYVAEGRVKEREPFLTQCAEVLRFSALLRVTLSENLGVEGRKTANFNYDILAWRVRRDAGEPLRPSNGRICEYEFFMDATQRQILERQIKQFYTGNLNAALRKMSEDTSPDQFFYQVREVNNPSFVR
jgi:radical SAM superfamily enzyme YgiQ (UPF0313 family)